MEIENKFLAGLVLEPNYKFSIVAPRSGRKMKKEALCVLIADFHPETLSHPKAGIYL